MKRNSITNASTSRGSSSSNGSFQDQILSSSPETSYSFSCESVRLNPYKVKKKGLKLSKSECDFSNVLEKPSCGLAPIDDTDVRRSHEILTIRKDSSNVHQNTKRMFNDMFSVIEDVGCCAGASSVELREDHKMPPKHVKWWQVTLFLLNDINMAWLILYSAMIPGLYGWVLGMLIIAGLWPMNIYIANLLWRCRNVFPGAISIGDLVYYLSQSTWAMYITFFFVNVTIALHLGYLMSTAGQNIYWLSGLSSEKCSIIFLAGVCLVLLPITQFRTLHSLSIINGINLICMLFFVAIYMYSLAQDGRDVNAVTSVGPNVNEWQEFSLQGDGYRPLVGVDTMIVGFHYQLLILEIMAEMKDPSEFPKANYWCTPIVLITGLGCAAFRYYFQGEEATLTLLGALQILDSIFDENRNGLAYFAVICFTIEMIGSCLIRSVILTRSMQLLIHPQGANMRTWRSRLEWAAISVLVVGFAFLLAFIAGITLYLTIIASFLVIGCAIILPIILFIICRWKNEQLKLIEWYEWLLMVGIVVLCVLVITLYILKYIWRAEYVRYEEQVANLSSTAFNMATECSPLY